LTTEHTRIEADGQRRPVASQGCKGWETASFSSDGRRLYLRSEQTCAAGMTRTQSGVLGLAANGEWTSAVHVLADSGNSVRVSRYSPVSLNADIPAEIRDELQPRELSDRTAHVAASLSRLNTTAMIEASKYLSAPAIEAWVTEAAYDFELNDKTLVQLADGGVAPSTIDVMIAVSNPNAFAVRASGMGYANASDSLRALRNAQCVTPTADPWGYSEYDPCDPYHRFSYYGTRSRYGYGYDPFGLEFSRYGIGYGRGNAYTTGPVVIVTRGSESAPTRAHGRMTDDGYRRTTGSSGSDGTAARGSTPRSDPSPTSSSSGTTSGSSGSSSSSSSGGGDGGRTATRKPPTA
jgi:hypothetical protein